MPGVASGLDVLLRQGHPWLDGAHVGLLTHPAAVTGELVAAVDALHRLERCRLAALFAPEHGIRGDAQAGTPIATETDARTGLPIYSLYGDIRKPTPEMLREVDLLIVDLQDAGVRFYTYLYSMAYVLQAAAENGVRALVLDRPAPINGETIEGPVLEPEHASFVGLYPIPIRPGMTIGELARLFNDAFHIGAELDVVPMSGWQRWMWFDETGLPWVLPSPNLPTIDSLTVYPGTCLIEGTNVSEGRGTTRPFELIGAPWIDPYELADALEALQLPGVRFRPAWFRPMARGCKYEGDLCGGVQLHVTDRGVFRPVSAGIHLIQSIRTLYPDAFSWREQNGRYAFDRLVGNSRVRRQIERGVPAAEIVQSWRGEIEAFRELRSRFLMY
ncbi:MAG: DUF1343 domain-containing protein [Anaerolineae bacterium]